MAQGPLIYNALIIPLSSSSAPPRPHPGPPGPGGGTPPGGGSPPYPDQTLPGDLPHPEHPIYWPLPPDAPVDPSYGIPVIPGMEGGAPRPDQGLPEPQPHPDQGLPGPQPHPEHPIVLPPDSGGWLPVYIWGPNDPRPTPPIVIPPDGETDDGAPIKFFPIWTPSNGWQVIGLVLPEGPHPTPSRGRR
jgi:hypothetical protein